MNEWLRAAAARPLWRCKNGMVHGGGDCGPSARGEASHVAWTPPPDRRNPTLSSAAQGSIDAVHLTRHRLFRICESKVTDPFPRFPPSRTLLYDGARRGTIARGQHCRGIALGIVPSTAILWGARGWARGGGGSVAARGGGAEAAEGGGRKGGVARRREGRGVTCAAGGLTGTATPRAVRDTPRRMEGNGRGGVRACCAGVGGPQAVDRRVCAVLATERGGGDGGSVRGSQ